MNKELKKKYVELAKIIKALAHPSRIIIVDSLKDHGRCVSEITDLIGTDTSTVSKHISVLKNAGLLNSIRKKTNIIYTLRMPCILDFLDCAETVLENNAQSQMDIVLSCRRK